MSMQCRVLEYTKSYAQHIQSMHDDIHVHINLSNYTYKCIIDSHK